MVIHGSAIFSSHGTISEEPLKFIGLRIVMMGFVLVMRFLSNHVEKPEICQIKSPNGGACFLQVPLWFVFTSEEAPDSISTFGVDMTHYIDGFVLPIPGDRLNEYKRVAAAVAEIWREHGALDYREYAGDDLVLAGTRSFTDLVAAGEGETIVFGWVEFESREARDRANERVASDPRMAQLIEPLIDPSNTVFDAERMAYGGFRVLLD